MMYFAIKYARKKYKERQASKLAGQDPSSAEAQLQVQPAVEQPTAEQEAAEPGQDEKAAAPTVPSTTAPVQETTAVTDEAAIQKKKRRRYRVKIIFGLVAPFALQALDTTIIASALPYIAKDFNEVKQLNWIISAFNLTSAAFLPFWAQIADVFGRHTTLQVTILIMLAGSAICTGAPTRAFGVLLLGRGLQGVGAAGVNICVRIALADRVSLRDYAVNWTLFSLASAISFSIGPVIGGFLTEANWRWCFAINLPVGVLAIVLAILLLRKELLGPQPLPEIEGHEGNIKTRRGRFFLRLSTIDYGGQLLFLWGLGLLILALTWAGGSYPWRSAHVLAPLVIGAVLVVCWVLYEYSMAPARYMARVFPVQRAMIPWELLSQRDIGLLFFINFGAGMAMFSVMYFMDLYFALVKGNSASQGGIGLLYFLPGLGVGAYMAMFMCNIWPRQTLPPIMLGSITSAIGITVIAYAVNTERTALLYGMMALTGHGVGMRMNPGSLHGLAYFPTMTAPITFLVTFAFPFGGSVALTLMSTVFNNKSGANHTNAKQGIHFAFISMIPFMWLMVLLSAALGNVWIRKEGDHEVVNGIYLLSLITRKKLVRERKSRGDHGLDKFVAKEGNGDKEEKTADALTSTAV